MKDFPKFMKSSANRIAKSEQATPGVEGYVFDGVDGSQMAFWTCTENASSAEHVHEYDEYMIVVQGCYTLIMSGERIPIRTGEEYSSRMACGTVVRSWPALERSTRSEAIEPTECETCEVATI